MPRTKYNPDTDTRNELEKAVDANSKARNDVKRLRERLEAAETAVVDTEQKMHRVLTQHFADKQETA